MCGIIGYTGGADAVPKIITGLSVLEYRGYDSAGIAAQSDEQTKVVKCRGRVDALAKKLCEQPVGDSTCALGHTRWATHGAPSDHNAHPHRAGAVTLVHNGIIENYKELRAQLAAAGVTFLSETDTEVAAALVDAHYAETGDPVTAIRAATAQMRGTYAFGILFADRRGEVYAVRRGSPLLLGSGADGFYLASDLTALLPFTDTYYPLEEERIAKLTPSAAFLLSETGETQTPAFRVTTMTPEAAQKGGFAHFMQKEIHEQPRAVIGAVSPRVNAAGLPDFSADGIEPAFWRGVEEVQIVACGSAMHAGLLGVRWLADVAGIPAVSYIASEYRYHPPVTRAGTLVVLISQSGETADTIAALRHARSRGVPTLAIVNVAESTIAREADHCIYTFAGPEIAVATTKGYCTQAAILALIAAATGAANGNADENAVRALVRELLTDVPAVIEKMLADGAVYRAVASKLAGREHVFYIGRGQDAALAAEAALKLKEISYIHCEAYAAGELKHGTISLVEPGTPVLALATEEGLFEKTESNIREVESRGAQVTLICCAKAAVPADLSACCIRLPDVGAVASVFAALAAVQCIAYETAVLRECDVDRPRNLAKSVTVE